MRLHPMQTLPTLFFAAAAVACSAGNAPVSRADVDPSNPNAPQGAPLVAASASPMPAASAEPSHAGHAHAGGAAMSASPGRAPASSSAAATAKYTCPMHPEVVSDAPGRCPKCGMDLVAKK